MQEWRKNVFVLWAAVFIAAASWTMVMPFMPVFLEDDLGVTVGVTVWAGVLGAVNSGFGAISAPIWGALGDRFGRKPMMIRAGLVLGVSYTVMAFVTNPYQLLGVRMMIGALTGFIPTATALVGTTTPREHLGKALSLVATGNQAGAILGPMLGGFLADLVGIRQAMLVSGVLVTLATLVVLFLVRERFERPTEKRSGLFGDMGQVLHSGPLLLVLAAAAILTASMSAMEPVLVPYIKDLLGENQPNWLAGIIYSMPGVAFVIAAPWWAARGERVGYSTTVALGLLGGAIFIVPQALVGSGFAMGGLRLVAGLALAAVSPGIASLITVVVPLDQRGRAFGMQQSAFNVGQMFGPVLGGLVGDRVGIPWVFPVTAALLLVGAACSWFFLRSRERQISQQNDDLPA